MRTLGILLCGVLALRCGGGAKGTTETTSTTSHASKSSAPVRGELGGICEASAIVQWDGGYVIADNEGEKTLYALDEKMQLTSFAFEPKYEVRDVEALAIVGDSPKLVLIGSHSTNKDGDVKPKRNLVQVQGQASRDIDLTGCAPCESARGIKPNEGGLSIEGAAYWKNTLWLGVRSPLKDNKALLLEMQGDLATGDKVTVRQTIQIDLGGRGIRDLVARDNVLYVLAGPTVDADAEHALYALAEPSAGPVLVSDKLPPHAEGIAPTATRNGWLLVIDGDGAPGETCKVKAEWARIRF